MKKELLIELLQRKIEDENEKLDFYNRCNLSEERKQFVKGRISGLDYAIEILKSDKYAKTCYRLNELNERNSD